MDVININHKLTINSHQKKKKKTIIQGERFN